MYLVSSEKYLIISYHVFFFLQTATNNPILAVNDIGANLRITRSFDHGDVFTAPDDVSFETPSTENLPSESPLCIRQMASHKEAVRMKTNYLTVLEALGFPVTTKPQDVSFLLSINNRIIST